MAADNNEDEQLRSVTLQNAQSILLARLRDEEDLRKQSEWLRVTLASIGDAVISTDAEGRVTFMNAVAESLTGWTIEEAQGKPLEEVFHIFNETSRARGENPVSKVLQTGAVVGLANHTILLAKNGFEIPIDDSAAPMRDEQGNIYGVVLVFRDITGRRQAEAAQLHLAEIVDSSDDAIVSKTLDGRIKSWNKAAERIFGYTAAEAIGQPIYLLIPPELREEEDQILGRLKRGERIDHYVTRRRKKDGTLIDVSLTISPIKNNEGELIGASKIARDITEQKCAEERLRELAARLSEADRRKNEFLAMLAHELRNPLAPIRNALQIVRLSEIKDEAVKSASEIMGRQIDHMVHLIDDLLDISRISQGKIELRRELVELTQIIHQAIETCGPTIERARQDLTVMLPPQPIYLHADPVRLAQIFCNLLNNSCKYSEPGGRISLTAEQHGSDVVVSMKDTGVGIPPDMLPKIFEMFTQVDRSLERSQGGLGIGLSLVQRLVEMHDGSVSAFSKGPGQGSEFVVRLPIVEGIEQPVPESADSESATTPARRFLVVDDNRDSADSMAMWLKITGNQTHTAYDGLEAMEAAATFRPEVVLLDIGLPKLNGYEVARKIRQQPWGKSMVLVALTGWGQEEDRRKSSEAGFNGHLVKPVDLDNLMKLLAEIGPSAPPMGSAS
ncbi:MAG: PAS domain S-box protein [Acidobacteriota bacterium]